MTTLAINSVPSTSQSRALCPQPNLHPPRVSHPTALPHSIPSVHTSLHPYCKTLSLSLHRVTTRLSQSLSLSLSNKMMLRAPPAFALTTGNNLSRWITRSKGGCGLVVCRGSENNRAVTGVVFEPFEELKLNCELTVLPAAPQESLARHKYDDDCEAAINEQINVEYNVSYVYHAMYAFFDRDNVALKGLAKFFKDSSDEERQHAEKLMEYQNKRGGKVKLQTIIAPLSEFDHVEKGDALYAMELALSLEKLVNEKLLNLHAIGSRSNDAQLLDFIESEFLNEQVEAIKKISEYVSELRRVGKGHGVWHFDQMLLEEAGAAA